MFSLIPILEQTDANELMKWHIPERLEDGSFTFPYPIYADVVNQWMRFFDGSELMIPYQWGDWISDRGFANRWSELDYTTFSTQEICKIFTALIRAERFSDGVIGKFFQEGNMIKCLKVLARRINQN
jgi:Family of unknown function (DUF6508)